jgi:hypothetical protein
MSSRLRLPLYSLGGVNFTLRRVDGVDTCWHGKDCFSYLRLTGLIKDGVLKYDDACHCAKRHSGHLSQSIGDGKDTYKFQAVGFSTGETTSKPTADPAPAVPTAVAETVATAVPTADPAPAVPTAVTKTVPTDTVLRLWQADAFQPPLPTGPPPAGFLPPLPTGPPPAGFLPPQDESSCDSDYWFYMHGYGWVKFCKELQAHMYLPCIDRWVQPSAY